MNSGVNLRRAASTPLRATFAFSFSSSGTQLRSRRPSQRRNPSFGVMIGSSPCAPRLLVMKIMAREKSTLRLSPSVSVALSRMPSSRFHRASLAFSISSNSTKLIFIVSV